MLIAQRLEKIKQILEEQKSVSIEELAEKLHISKDTVRRDLIKLENKKVLRRTHGGAVLANKEAEIFDYVQRSAKYYPVKQKIAKKVRQVIKDDASIIFDSSTTVEAVIRQLSDRKIHAITNSLTHAQLLASFEKTTISMLPGTLHKEQLFLYGADTIDKLSQFRADYTLLGIFALSKEGLFIHTEEEGLVKRKMIQQGNFVIAAADHTKLGTTGFFKVGDLSDLDLLITDRKPEEELLAKLTEANVEIMITEEEKTK